MPTKNHKTLDRIDQSSKRLTPHTYTKWSRRRKEKHLREGEWKTTTEKSEPKLEARNNLPNTQSVHREKHYPNLEWQTWRKAESLKIWAAMKAATRWENREGRREKWIKKTVEPSLSYEREHRSWSLKTISWKQRRAGNIDGKPITRKTPSKTTNSEPTHGDAIPNISWNLRKNMSSQY